MKVILSVVVIMILMIGAPSLALANQADTEQEAGIASDSNGVPSLKAL